MFLSSLSAANLLSSSFDESTAKACAIVETASNEISVIEDRVTSSVDSNEYRVPGQFSFKTGIVVSLRLI